MTKVEELRARLLGYDPCIGIDDEGNLKDAGVVPHCIGIIPAEVDALISAAHAEGVAEGAEQMKQEIWVARLVGYGILTAPVPPPKYVLVPVSVLAPTKEVAG